MRSKDIFLISLSLFLLVLTGSIAYYFFIYIPTKEQQKQNQALLREKQIQDQVLENRKLQEACIQSATTDYSSNWVRVCNNFVDEQIASDKKNYDNCIITGLGIQWCKNTWIKTYTKGEDCKLPSNQADSYNKNLESAKNDCKTKYPIQ